MPTYKDINLLTQKAAVAGTEKLPVSDTEYITPDGITADAEIEINGIDKNYTRGFLDSNGIEGDASDAVITGYVRVDGGDVVVWNHKFSSTKPSYCLCTFNSSYVKTHYYSCNAVNSRTITMPSDVYYMRATMYSEAGDATLVIGSTTVWSKINRVDGIKQNLDRLDYINEYMSQDASFTDTDLINGTQNNAANTNQVRTERVAVTVGHTYSINITRTPPSGHYYTFGYATYSSLTGAINANQVRAKDAEAEPQLTEINLTINTGEVGLLFLIVERDSGGTVVPLRETDFLGYRVMITDVTEPYGTLSTRETTANKVTSLSAASTDTQYPSAKCVYDLVGDIETLLSAI